MDKKEKKIIENLDYMTEDVKVPDSLKPEAVEEMLKAHKVEKSRNRKKSFYWKPAYSGAMAAAALFLVISGVAARGELPAGRLPERRIADFVPKKDFAKEVKAGIEPIAHPDNYREVFKYIKKYHDRMKLYDSIGKRGIMLSWKTHFLKQVKKVRRIQDIHRQMSGQKVFPRGYCEDRRKLSLCPERHRSDCSDRCAR